MGPAAGSRKSPPAAGAAPVQVANSTSGRAARACCTGAGDKGASGEAALWSGDLGRSDRRRHCIGGHWPLPTD